MNSRKVTQSSIRAGGDVVGGDKIVHEAPRRTRLQVLVAQLKQGIQQDPDAKAFVEQLQEWMSPKATAFTRDLATKLKDCGKGHLVSDATMAKERFAKLLTKATFQTSIQDVYAHILGMIWGKFTHVIKPCIRADNQSGATEQAIWDLAAAINDELAEAPPELGLGIPEILGMIYYLTGNCHLEWDDASLPSSD